MLLLRSHELDHPQQDGWQQGNTIALWRDASEARLYALALHEFAHYLGVGHKRCRKGQSHVMSVISVGQYATRLTPALRKRWCRQLSECL